VFICLSVCLYRLTDLNALLRRRSVLHFMGWFLKTFSKFSFLVCFMRVITYSIITINKEYFHIHIIIIRCFYIYGMHSYKFAYLQVYACCVFVYLFIII
jgi:hypothetical protein